MKQRSKKAVAGLKVLAIFLLVIHVQVTSSAPANTTNATVAGEKLDNTTKTNNTLTQISTNQETPYTAAATLKDCTLTAENDIVLKVKELLSDGATLIKYHLNIPNFDRIIKGKNSSLMYRPLYWVRSTGRYGLGLLLLKPSYDRLSLNTLELGVETLEVEVQQHPTYCLRQLNDIDIELLMREFVMNDFQNTSSGIIVELKPNDNVCNLHLTNLSGTADFRYLCCQRNEFKEIHCTYLESDVWLNILFVVITLIKILVVLFSPKLVPDVYYRVKHVAASYIHECQSDKKVRLTTAITTEPDADCYNSARVKVKLSKLYLMEGFKKYISGMRLDEPRRISLSRLNMRVKHDRLLSENSAPVGLLGTLNDSLVKCGISKRQAVTECCNADFFFKSPCGKVVSWYRILRGTMKALLLILLALPWVLRIYAYYRWEHDEMHLRKDAAKERSLKFYFPGNVTLLLTPLHVLFILIYVLLSIESCIFGVLKRKVQERLKMVLRKCFRDMREMSKMEVVGWAVKVLIKPCTAFGGLGICIGAVFWGFALPFTTVILAFYLLPTLNITVRLLAHFAVFLFPKNVCTKYVCCAKIYSFLESCEIKLEMENISKSERLEKNKKLMSSYSSRFEQCLIIVLCLISMYSVIFLVTELVSFLVEVFVYTLMGIILNAGTILTYVSLLFILGVYGNECFGHVTKRFLAFNKKMNSVILDLCKKKVQKVVYSNEENYAFSVQTDNSMLVDKPVELVKDADGRLQWKVKRLCLFLSRNDEPLIPTSFYFTSCRMPFYAAPGELLLSYLKAGMEFGAILVFLVFVLIVVMAFGDTYEISATNKLLATVAGGFLPFMLRKIIFKSHVVPTIDEENLHFQILLTDLLDNYEENWPIYDIDATDRDVDECDVTSDQNGSNGTNGNGHSSMDSPIDLLIDVREIDADDFPDLIINVTSPEDPTNIGSTSLLEDTESDMKNIV